MFCLFSRWSSAGSSSAGGTSSRTRMNWKRFCFGKFKKLGDEIDNGRRSGAPSPKSSKFDNQRTWNIPTQLVGIDRLYTDE